MGIITGIVQNPNGFDLIFSPNADASSPYDHEVETGSINYVVIGAARVVSGGDIIVNVTGHPFVTGQSILIDEHIGLGFPRGKYTVTVIDANHFSLDSTGNISTGTSLGGNCIGLYDATTGKSAFWVRIPSLSSSVNNTFYVFYNKSGVTTNPENRPAVWSSIAQCILHLRRAIPYLTFPGATPPFVSEDSTVNALNFVEPSGTVPNDAYQLGEIQNGLKADGFPIRNQVFPNIVETSPFSLYAWILPFASAGSTFNYELWAFTTVANGEPVLRAGVSAQSLGGNPYININNVTNYFFTGITVPYDRWTALIFTATSAVSATAYLYDPTTGILQSQTISIAAIVGMGVADSCNFAGNWRTPNLYDEGEIYNVELPANRIKTEVVNQSDPSMLTIGAEDSSTGPWNGYNFRRLITVDHTKVFGTQTNFPLMIQGELPADPAPPVLSSAMTFTLFGGNATKAVGPPAPPVIVSRKCVPNVVPIT